MICLNKDMIHLGEIRFESLPSIIEDMVYVDNEMEVSGDI